MNYHVAIPSYKRAITLQEKTLTTLRVNGVNPSVIDVFVADKEEYEVYRDVLNPDTYGRLIIGKPTLRGARNFIRGFYPENTCIWFLDDDVSGLFRKKGSKVVPFTDGDRLSRFVFKLMFKYGTRLCGLYAVNNGFFMKNTVSVGLYFVVGNCYWCINGHDEFLMNTLDDKEDYERSIKYYLKYGKVLRLNNITTKTNYYTEPGGMQEYREASKMIKSGRYLIRKYPDLIMENKARKGERLELRFKLQPGNFSVDL